MATSLLKDPTCYLTAEDYREFDGENVEEDDFPEGYWLKSNIDCEGCGDFIAFQDETILILIVQSQKLKQLNEYGREEEIVQCYPVQNEDGDFAFEPIFLHFECWEDAYEEYSELIADELCLGEPKVKGVQQCTFCKEQISEWEPYAWIRLGEITTDARLTGTESSFKEAEGGSPEPVCMSCMDRINDQCIELWR